MEFKGTKGEWIADLEYIKSTTIVEIKAGDSNTDDWAVFTLYNAKDRETQEANAKLIAAAPEMLAQLQEVLSYLESDTKAEAEEMLSHKIQQLIKKATL